MHFLRSIDGKIAGIPQCRALGTTLHITYLNFGAVIETIMELLRLKKRRGAQKSVITRQITKLGETENMDHFQTIMKSLQTKYAALVDLNENILALTDEDDYETEMVDTEDFMLDLKLKLQDFQKLPIHKLPCRDYQLEV